MKKWITKHGIEVTRLDGFRCFCYVIETESEKWLIDTSTLSDKKRIQKQMEKGCIDTLNGIILTHAHISHVEAASFYSEKFQCPIYTLKSILSNAGFKCYVVITSLNNTCCGNEGYLCILLKLGNCEYTAVAHRGSNLVKALCHVVL